MGGFKTVIFLLFVTAVTSSDLKDFLHKHGYFNKFAYHGNENDALKSAISAFQSAYNLRPTGTVDDETAALFSTPRCGVSDLLYNQPGNKWERDDLSYYYRNYSPDLPRDELKRLTRRAFQYWSDVTPFKFTEKSIGNIVLYYGNGKHDDGRGKCYAKFDGKGGELAHAFFPPDGRLHFDEDEYFTTNTTLGVNYLWVATHELGHVLGLTHDTKTKGAVMYPYYKKYDPKGMSLHANDIKRIQAMYGPGGLYPTLFPKVCKDLLSNCNSVISFCKSEVPSWKELVHWKCKKTCGFC